MVTWHVRQTKKLVVRFLKPGENSTLFVPFFSKMVVKKLIFCMQKQRYKKHCYYRFAWPTCQTRNWPFEATPLAIYIYSV